MRARILRGGGDMRDSHREFIRRVLRQRGAARTILRLYDEFREDGGVLTRDELETEHMAWLQEHRNGIAARR